MAQASVSRQQFWLLFLLSAARSPVCTVLPLVFARKHANTIKPSFFEEGPGLQLT